MADATPADPTKPGRRWTSRKLWFALIAMGCGMFSAHVRWIDGPQLVSWVTYTVAAYMLGNTGTAATDALKSLAQALWARKDS